MRSLEQVKRVAQDYSLDRRRISILIHKRKDIETQEQLQEIACDLKRASDDLCSRLLNNVSHYTSRGVASSWGKTIMMKDDK